jgi:ABC-type bacteriocin/lantibiotic exporter with double-glycine peptidase domain
MITSAFIGWGLLGFYRGQRDYDYEFSKHNTTSLYLYSCRMIYGITGMCIYTFPLAWVVFIPIEIYRLEVYIRNLDEQNKEHYEANKKQKEKQRKQYRLNNPEKIKEQQKQSRERNKEKHKKYKKQWREQNKEKNREKLKEKINEIKNEILKEFKILKEEKLNNEKL